MKKLLFIFLFLSIAKAQMPYVDRIDSVSALPATGVSFHKYLYSGNLYIWAKGQWRTLSVSSTTAYPSNLLIPDTANTILSKANFNTVRGVDTNRAIVREGLKLNIASVKSGAYWDTTTYARGVVTIPAGDSIQVSITGLTSTSIATVAYKGGKMTADTMATWQVCTAGKLSIYGKFGKIISYIVGR